MSGAVLPLVCPRGISAGSVFGPGYSTTIVETAGGDEARNMNWAQARYRGNLAAGITDLQRLQQLVALFHAAAGRACGWLFEDPLDHHSAAPGLEPGPFDQALGTGDGIATGFALRKAYVRGSTTRYRTITRPVAGSVRCAVNGVETAAFSLDATTGRVTFAVAPAAGHVVQAGFRFHVPVRFDTDRLETSWEAWAAGGVPDLPIVEVREC